VDGRVIRMDTFSKYLAPGLRCGFLAAQPAVIEKYKLLQETTCQSASGFVSWFFFFFFFPFFLVPVFGRGGRKDAEEDSGGVKHFFFFF
jgi:hypothetical protein